MAAILFFVVAVILLANWTLHMPPHSKFSMLYPIEANFFDKLPNSVALTMRCRVVICATPGNVRFRNFEPMDYGTQQMHATFSRVPIVLQKYEESTVGTAQGRCRELSGWLLLAESTILWRVDRYFFWISNNCRTPWPSEDSIRLYVIDRPPVWPLRTPRNLSCLCCSMQDKLHCFVVLLVLSCRDSWLSAGNFFRPYLYW